MHQVGRRTSGAPESIRRPAFFLTVGVLVLAACLVPSPAGAARKGGTLKGMFASDVDFIDPSLAYYVHSWQVMGAIGANLVRFADAEGAAGSRLVPEVAARMPTVSRDGRTYTFSLRRTFRFSNAARTPVTAHSFAWAIRRALDPRMQSPARAFVADVADVRALSRYRLRLRLSKPAPDILTRLAMPFFMAMDPRLHPVDPKGIHAPLHTAGPYFVASWAANQRLVVRRNPAYGGARPANVASIEYEANVNLDSQVLKLKSGQADFAAEGIAPSAHSELARQFGVNKGRYHVRPVPTTYYLAMNTTRGITRSATVRKAINWAVDRKAMVAQRGFLAGKPADQILPPGIPGFRDFSAYPLRFTDANLARAKRLMGGRTGRFLLLSGNRGAGLTVPQIVDFNLGRIGIDVETQFLASGPLVAKAGSRREDFQGILIGWHADYPDPYNFVDILLNGTNIQEKNNNNYAYLNVPALNRRMEAASVLSGARRYEAYRRLDVEITTRHAPWASYMVANNRDFVSARLGCYEYHPTFSMNLAAVCLK